MCSAIKCGQYIGVVLETYRLYISAGQGPEECAFAVSKMFEKIAAECETRALGLKKLKTEPAEFDGNCKSVLLEISGMQAGEFSESWSGTIKCIFESPYRKNHKRKNWYLAIACRKAGEQKNRNGKRKMIVTAARASGPGGQNVNKRSTAVRITDSLSGITVRSAEERSQMQNRKKALEKLERKIAENSEQENRRQVKSDWSEICYVERGNETRTYKGLNFERIL